MVRRFLGALAIIGWFTFLPAAASAQSLAAGDNLELVTVDDTAGVLNHQKLQDALDDIDFYEPTKVAILTREGEYSDNINTETLLFARENRPEWISDDPADYGDYWDDNYFIITLSIEGPGDGQIGTYFGEDRKVDDSTMESIHEAGYDDFNAARWTDGVIQVAERGAEVMNRPVYRSPGLYWTAGAGGVGAAAVGGGVAIMRSNRRSKFATAVASGRTHLASVSTGLDETEISARTLPSASRHASLLEQRFADFMSSYREAFTEQQALEAADKKLMSSSDGVYRAEKFDRKAEDLDFTDNAIVQAAALYTRSPNWQDAWREQTAPLVNELAEIPNLSIQESGTDAELAALKSFQVQAMAEVEKLTADLAAETIDVDTALDRLADLRKQLTQRLDEFVRVQIDAFADSQAEKEQIRDEIRKQRAEVSRNRRRRGNGSILDVTSAGDLFWTVDAVVTGYRDGRGSVVSDRQRAASSSSGGISHGYSGGGGSFSGAGGSSRF